MALGFEWWNGYDVMVLCHKWNDKSNMKRDRIAGYKFDVIQVWSLCVHMSNNQFNNKLCNIKLELHFWRMSIHLELLNTANAGFCFLKTKPHRKGESDVFIVQLVFDTLCVLSCLERGHYWAQNFIHKMDKFKKNSIVQLYSIYTIY